MGLDELHMYDLYVPIVEDFEMKLPYEEAFDLVLQGLKPMGEDYLAKLREAREKRVDRRLSKRRQKQRSV